MLPSYKLHNLLIQKRLRLKGTGETCVSAKILIAHIFHGNHVKIITHTIPADHRSGNLGRLLNIIGGTGSNRMEDQLFRCTAACKCSDLILQFFLTHQEMFLFIHLHGISQCTGGTWNDRDLMDRCRICLLGSNQCMTNLMIGNDQFFLIGKYTILFLISGNNNFDTFFKIRLCGKFPSVTDRTESCLIDNIGKLRTGGPDGRLGNFIKPDCVRNFDLLGMDLQDFLTPLKIRKLNRDPSVKTSRTKKCRVKGIRSVGSCQDHNTLGTVKTIHLCQKLVQCLFTLIVSAAHSGAVTFLADGIDLINKYNTWCFLLGLFKKITYLGSTHTNKHLHKFRTGN